MYKEFKAYVAEKRTDGSDILRMLIPSGLDEIQVDRFAVDGVFSGEIRIDDGRTISGRQRRKIYAMFADIALYSGYRPREIEELKDELKLQYMGKTGVEDFSLSDTDMTNARLFINFLIDLAFEYDIPLMDLVLNRTEDVNATLYASIMHKKCIICGQKGELHHEDAVGMGRRRKEIIHMGMSVICLCRKHHTEAHMTGKKTFNEKYIVYGIEANREICKAWKLKYE